MRSILLAIIGVGFAGCQPQGDQEPVVPGPDQPPGNASPIADISEEPVGTAARRNAGDAAVSPCLTQGEERLQVTPIRAVGTEPFWGARVEGRCVTYSTPDNQQGVRVWTRYSLNGGVARWIGQLNGKPFEMQVRAERDCSDGMSDQRYPMGVEMTVEGEKRHGCATPL